MSSINLELPESLKISDVVSVKAMLDDALSSDSPVEMDGLGLDAIDYSGMQMLVVFVRELESRGHAITWKGVSEPLQNAAENLGLTSFLQI